jgi:hypothetical protein
VNLKSVVDRLLAVHDPEGCVITLSLHAADSGILPAETRVFLKDRLRSLVSESRTGFEGIAARIRNTADSTLRPEAQGLYLVAAPNHWEAVELRVPLPNYLHVGTEPYLAPLLASIQESPKVYVASTSEREAALQVVELGLWSELGRWQALAVDRDPERILSGRTPVTRSGMQRASTGIGGGRRDRYEQTLEAGTSRMLRGLTHRMAGDHAKAPAAAVYYFGDREHFPVLRPLLPAALRNRAENLGPAPRREPAFRQMVMDLLKRRIAERHEAEIREFQERRAEGHLVALGPADVLVHRTSGKLARVFLDPLNPVMATKCRACEALDAGPDARCGYCGGRTRPVSLTQVIVAHAISHPPLALTFVSSPADWLKELGGVAGLLSQKGIRRRR